MTSSSALFAVRRYYTQDKKWMDISLIGEDGYFRGPALFDKKSDAQQYLEFPRLRVFEVT